MSELIENDAALGAAEEVPTAIQEVEDATEMDGQKEESDVSPEEEGTSKFTPEQQREIGKLLSQERKRLKAQFERSVSSPMSTVAPTVGANQIFDPKTGLTVELDTPMGQLVYREQLIAQKEAREQEAARARSKQAEYDQLSDRLTDAEAYIPALAEARQVVASYASDAMVDALAGIDNPAQVVAFLGEKKGELQRIQRLTPAKQMKEIFTLAERLVPHKKMVSNAPAPMSKTQSTGGISGIPTRAEMNADQRREYYEKRFNTR